MGNDVGILLGKPKEVKVYAEDTRWVLPKALIGVEFEYEGVPDVGRFMTDNSVLFNYWETHQDDSLKDHGMEFVFRAPLFGSDSYKAIESLMLAAVKAKFKCSLRAGIHVHMDVRDLETSQLVGLIILYAILEPIIFDWIGDGREHSIYCVPLYKADESLSEAVRIVRSIHFDEINETTTTFQNAKNFARYAALNLNALSKFGTVEFRHMKTTHDLERVVDWVNIILSLKAATYKVPTSDGAIVRMAATSTAREFMDYVLGPELTQKMYTPSCERRMHYVGIPTARDLALNGLSMTDWTDPKEYVRSPTGSNLGFAKFLKKLPDRDPKLAEPIAPKKPGKMKFIDPYMTPQVLMGQHQQAAQTPMGLNLHTDTEEETSEPAWPGSDEVFTTAE